MTLPPASPQDWVAVAAHRVVLKVLACPDPLTSAQLSVCLLAHYPQFSR